MFIFIRRYWRSRGFTQLEIFAIVMIIGILSAIAAPSFGGMLEAARMNQATAELRNAFQETQRAAIRQNIACQTNVVISGRESTSSTIQGNCLSENSQTLPKGIGLITNVLPSDVASSPSSTSKLPPGLKITHASISRQISCTLFSRNCPQDKNESSSSSSDEVIPDIEVQVGFGRLGAANFEIAESESNSARADDPSAKFISYRYSNEQGRKSCIVLSRSLGLTRIGTYDGSLNPFEITSDGKCQVNQWSEQ